MAAIGGGGAGQALRILAVHRAVGPGQRLHRGRMEVVDTARCAKALVADLHAQVGIQPGGGGADVRLDFGAHGVGVLAGVEAHAQAQGAGAGHRGIPLAALDAAQVDVDRVGHVGKGGMAAPGRIPLGLQRLQVGHHRLRRLDRVQAAAHVAHMGRPAGQRDLQPQHADLGAHQRLGKGLGNDDGVEVGQPRLGHGLLDADATSRGGACAAPLQLGDNRQRAVAGVFLVHHGVEAHDAGRLPAQTGQGLVGHQRADQAALHVARAAAVQPAVGHPGRERRALPQAFGAGGHHVQVAVEQQRPARQRSLGRQMPRQQVVAAAIGVAGAGEQRRAFDGGAVLADALGRQAQVAQRGLEHGHRRLLGARRAGRGHQVAERGQHPRLQVGHGLGEGGGVGHCHGGCADRRARGGRDAAIVAAVAAMAQPWIPSARGRVWRQRQGP